MEYRSLGKSGLTVSAIGFGAWAAGGAWWGEANDRDATAALQRAFDLGITLYDTAPAYGFGHSEELLGKALGAHRQEIIIATKFGLQWDESLSIKNLRRVATRERILYEVDESLRRLKVDCIDLYQQHWPDLNTPLEETMGTLLELVQAGKIRYIGVSNFDAPLMAEALRYAPIVANQIPYSMLRRGIEAETLPFCQEHGLGVLAYGPLHHGLLTGKFTPGYQLAPGDWRAEVNIDFQGERYLHNLRLVEALRPLATERGVTVGQLAIAWTLMSPAVSCSLVGAKNAAQVEQNVGGAGWRLSADEMERIEEILRME